MRKGSRGRLKNVMSIQGKSNERFRNQLATEGIMAAQDKMLIFALDHLFARPSMAAMALMGRSANGWLEWKDLHGKTLHEMKRQSVTVAG